ncbi:MAG: hypothetical protein WBG90_13470 [Saonia sp.]
MEMILVKSNVRNWLLVGTVLFIVLGCSNDKDNDANTTDQAILSQAEVAQILDTDELSGIADNIITGIFMDNPNGLSAKTQPDCYEADYGDAGFSVTFTDCSIDDAASVNGTLAVTYTSGEDSLSFTVSFDNFTVDGIVLNGTRSFSFNGLVEQDAFVFTVTSDMDLTLEDGTLISETGTKTFGFSLMDSLEDSGFTIDGDWTVTLDDNTYMITVDTTLKGNFSCDYLHTGILQISKNGIEVSVDFGDGSCDNLATLIYPDGSMEEFSLDD